MDKTNSVLNEMIKYYAGDVKRINHLIKVFCLARTIGKSENIDPQKQEILDIAAIVHDIGIKVSEEKYNSSSGKYQELEGPSIAKELLEKRNNFV